MNIYGNVAGDHLSPEELKLYNLINQYRNQNGLPSIAASRALSLVANRHVQDLSENVGYLTHAWSDAPYSAGDPSTYPSMWLAPQRFNTGYNGYGYENAYRHSREA
ncbi:MAG: CAP domain-containing protein, partial [Prochlorothrix sp.]